MAGKADCLVNLLSQQPQHVRGMTNIPLEFHDSDQRLAIMLLTRSPLEYRSVELRLSHLSEMGGRCILRPNTAYHELNAQKPETRYTASLTRVSATAPG